MKVIRVDGAATIGEEDEVALRAGEFAGGVGMTTGEVDVARDSGGETGARGRGAFCAGEDERRW